ncbi:hypothetical protein [Flavisolibacter tropicus]|uniref:Outer membrane protein beta-barrel domain-containing protein n=1 Tax=Flavisolibacter tropicus TaxID=1492898 RepID=A0A172TUU9_9BACT|nr:hypothetical protein [Flavisolibacter tropicus]ANE50748.1 hypothetical protein SY85_09805 [Flavisolibacter tropicus]
MKTIATFYGFLLLIGSTSCGVIPLNNQFEKAGTLKEGNIELGGNISRYEYMPSLSEDLSPDEPSGFQSLGARIGIGLTDKADLKFRYERQVIAYSGEKSRMNFFSIVPKFAIKEKEFSFLIPFSVYSLKDTYDSKPYTSNTFSIAPQLLYTFTSPKNKSDLTFGFKGEVEFGEETIIPILLFGGSVGAGFSSDLSKWAIRPEIGATFIGGFLDWSYGVGFQYTIPKRKRAH